MTPNPQRSRRRALLTLLGLLLPLAGLAFELRPQLGHTYVVNAVAYSPDGNYLASASDDRTIKLWEVKSGKELRSLKGSTGGILSVAYSPDGNYLAAASSDGVLTLWEIKSGTARWVITGHLGAAHAITFSPDGLLLASAGADRAARLWEVKTGKALRAFEGHTERVNAVAFSPDGKQLVSGSDDQTMRLWEVKHGVMLRAFEGHTQRVNAVAFSADGLQLATGSDDQTARLWEVFSDGTAISSLRAEAAVKAVALSPDGQGLVAGCADGNLKRWALPGGSVVYTVSAHSNWVKAVSVNAVAFSPDGTTLATGSSDQAIKQWDAATGKELRSSRNTGAVMSVAFSPNGKYLATAIGDKTIKLWEVASGTVAQTFLGHTDSIETVAFSPDGNYLATGSDDKTMRLWEVKSGKELRSFLGHTGVVQDVAFSPDGKLLASASWDNTIKLWSIKSGKEVRSLVGHTDKPWSIAFSPDGKYLASGGWDKTLRVWEVKSGKELRSLSGHSGAVLSVAFSPDGKQLASGSADQSLRLWQVSDGKELQAFWGHSSMVMSVAYSADGDYLASAGFADATARRWEVKSGKELHSFVGHSSFVLAVAYSPDGRHLASASVDGTARLWTIDGKNAMAMMSNDAGEWLIYTDEGLFDSSPAGVELVAAVEGMRGYSIDQLALKNNRPDLILKALGLGAPALLDYYYKRYLHRLKKAKIEDESKLRGSFEGLPTSTITEAKLASSGLEAQVEITLADKAGLKSYQVYVNGVALYEGFGKDLTGTQQKRQERLTLTPGENRLEVSALNTSGQESFRALAVLKGPEQLKRDLYFVGFGVSAYADPDIPDLSYAHKDAKELSEAFQQLQGYDNKLVRLYTNEQVTKASLAEAREFVKRARPQDTVVLFIAGHGLHDRDELATYYYIIHDTQLALDKEGSPQLDTATAISFEEIEGLLSGIDARQKLFLMDTCESGEREEGSAALAFTGANSRGLGARAIGIAKVTAAPKKAPKKPAKKSAARPWLLSRDRFIYQDLAKRTGAIVFSSSRGGEYSYESKKLENGLFTESLVEGLSKKAADANKDGSISTDELRRYVSRQVASLSGDLQHPTVDRDNLSLRLSFTP